MFFSRKGKSKRESGGVSTAHRELLEKQREIERKKKELEKTLQKVPEKMQKMKERQRRISRSDVVTTAPLARAGMGRASVRGGRGFEIRKSERDARVKFLILCLILATLLFLVWSIIPTS
jgi:Flp pilus assembly protein TadB